MYLLLVAGARTSCYYLLTVAGKGLHLKGSKAVGCFSRIGLASFSMASRHRKAAARLPITDIHLFDTRLAFWLPRRQAVRAVTKAASP